MCELVCRVVDTLPSRKDGRFRLVLALWLFLLLQIRRVVEDRALLCLGHGIKPGLASVNVELSLLLGHGREFVSSKGKCIVPVPGTELTLYLYRHHKMQKM